MQVQTNTLNGAALDWAVAKCQGARMEDVILPKWKSASLELRMRDEEGNLRNSRMTGQFIYHKMWEWAGPIIDREKISITTSIVPGEWVAYVSGRSPVFGKSAIVAAMRCYVASKLGDLVEIPDGLL